MGKPPGIGFALSGGVPVMRVRQYSRAEDLIWDAVREAIASNMTPEQFKREAAEAWSQCLKDDIRAAQDELLGGP